MINGRSLAAKVQEAGRERFGGQLYKRQLQVATRRMEEASNLMDKEMEIYAELERNKSLDIVIDVKIGSTSKDVLKSVKKECNKNYEGLKEQMYSKMAFTLDKFQELRGISSKVANLAKTICKGAKKGLSGLYNSNDGLLENSTLILSLSDTYKKYEQKSELLKAASENFLKSDITISKASDSDVLVSDFFKKPNKN